MKKRKNIAIPMILAATIAAVSVPCSSQIVMASDTYQDSGNCCLHIIVIRLCIGQDSLGLLHLG